MGDINKHDFKNSAERNEWIIYERLVKNRTYEDIAHDVNVGRQQVRNIVVKHQFIKKRREEEKSTLAIRRRQLAYINAVCRSIESATISFEE